MDGRDIGSVVLPDAEIKLYLYSSIDYRMRNWDAAQMEHHGVIDPFLRAKAREDIIKRDDNDLHRKIAPLIRTPDAMGFDMEQYGLEKVFQIVCDRIDFCLNQTS